MKFFEITWDIFVDAINGVFTFIINNLRNISFLLNITLPYLMYYIGQYVFEFRGKYATGGEVAIPVVIGLIIYYINSFANRIGKGVTVPIPNKRFTVKEDDGEITIEADRLQELILYTSDLEDWIERKGLL